MSLICAVAKIIEAAGLHRLAPQRGRSLDPKQYTYRRKRGAEFLLFQVYDFVCRRIGKGRFVCLAAAVVYGAFDNVPMIDL